MHRAVQCVCSCVLTSSLPRCVCRVSLGREPLGTEHGQPGSFPTAAAAPVAFALSLLWSYSLQMRWNLCVVVLLGLCILWLCVTPHACVLNAFLQ